MDHVMTFSRRRALGLGLGAAALAATGCSASQSGSSPSPSRNAINVGTNGDARNINPILAVDLDGRWRTDLMFDPLVLIDPKSLEPIPHLASWELSGDQRRYTFRLEPSARFHDGHPLTAEDVEFTVLSILSPDYGGPLQQKWARLDGADAVIAGETDTLTGLRAVDKHTVEMTLKEPYAAFLPVIARHLKPLPKHLLADAGTLTESSEFSLNPVGSGAYKFVNWTKGSSFEVEANPEYWGGAPAMDKITQTIIPDMNTLVSALKAGEIDSSIVPPPSAMDQLESNPDIAVHRMPPLTPEGLYFNLSRAPWKDNAVLRRAIAHGIDYQSFAKTFMAEDDPKPAAFLSYASWAYDPAGVPPQYDPNKAKQLLAEAGYPNGNGLKIEIAANAGNVFRQQEQTFVQEQLGRLGITVTVTQAEWGKFITAVRAGDYDIAEWKGGENAVPDPAISEASYVTNGSLNYSRYSNPEVDRLYAQAAATTDRDQRKKHYAAAQQILARDIPFLPGFWRPNPLAIKKTIHNVKPSVIGAYWNISEWTIG